MSRLLLVLLAGCATTGVASRSQLVSGIEATQLTAARERAPDIMAQSDQAMEAADHSSGQARDDHALRGRLLLEAAVAEAQRIVLDRQRDQVRAKGLEADQQRAVLVKERVAIDGQIRLADARRIAREEATRVYERAGRDERGARATPARDLQEARRVYLRRAHLVLAAAAAMEAPQPDLRRAHSAVASANRKPTVQAAEAALVSAERALSAARKRTGAPDAGQLSSLLARAKELGLPAQSLGRGVLIRLDGLFKGKGTGKASSAKARLEHVTSLLRAHPHGPVMIEVRVGGLTGKRQQRLAAARAKRVRGWLGDDPRLRPSDPPQSSAAGAGIDLLFSAYGTIHP